jgi:hypothetical protein
MCSDELKNCKGPNIAASYCVLGHPHTHTHTLASADRLALVSTSDDKGRFGAAIMARLDSGQYQGYALGR